MSLIFYSEEEDNNKEESISKYKDMFLDYENKKPTLSEALTQMFISSGAEQNQSKILVKDILSKCKSTIDNNLDKIKKEHPNISKDDAYIICSYTCESKKSKYSPYRLLNRNLVSENRKNGINKISKYLFILLRALRKLKRFYPNKENKYLYRCITSKVNLSEDPFNKKYIPYKVGNIKTFWGFTSTSQNVKMTYHFLKDEEKIKSGTIFSLGGDIWGYNIALFNYYGEEEILLEPERKYKVDNVLPSVNEIIYVNCKILTTPLVLDNNNNNIEENNINKNNDNDDNLNVYTKKIINKYIPKNSKNKIKKNKKNSYKFIYETSIKNEEIYIFSTKFVEKNKDKCHLIIDDKINYELKDKYTFRDIGEHSVTLVIKEGENVDFFRIFDFFSEQFSFAGIYFDFYKKNHRLIDASSLKYLDVSQYTNLDSMFCGCANIKDFSFLKNWDVSKCKYFNYTFSFCGFENLEFLSNWNLSSAESLTYMFENCVNLKDINHIKNWNLENAHCFFCMFRNCTSLKDINALQNWNMSNTRSVFGMFEYCENLITADSLYKWKLSDKVERDDIFNGCKKLLNIPSIFKKPSPSSDTLNQLKCFFIFIFLVLIIGFMFIGIKILKLLIAIIRYFLNLFLYKKN